MIIKINTPDPLFDQKVELLKLDISDTPVMNVDGLSQCR